MNYGDNTSQYKAQTRNSYLAEEESNEPMYEPDYDTPIRRGACKGTCVRYGMCSCR